MEIGKIIKENRTAKNMTQEQLANEFFVSRPLISKWENGKSYPDLEQLLKLSDFFDLTLDELMRGDKKMTKKLNFDIKKKKVLLLLSGILIILIVNYFLSNMPVEANPEKLEVTHISVFTDKNYQLGDDYDKDWNSIILAKISSKNIFFRPKASSFLTVVNGNEVTGHIEWYFSIFNVFRMNEKVAINQSFFIENFDSDHNFKMGNTKKKIPFELE